MDSVIEIVLLRGFEDEEVRVPVATSMKDETCHDVDVF